VACFIAPYHAIRSNDVYDELQKDLIEEWQKIEWKTICCSGHEKLVVFVGEQLLYFLML
jgi:hypothetical protein